MNNQFIPADADERTKGQLDMLRGRLEAYRAQDAENLQDVDDEARNRLLADVPGDVLSLEVQHVAEFAERNERAMLDLTGEVKDLRSRLDKALRDQALVEGDRDRIEVAYKALRDQNAGQDGGRGHQPNVDRADFNRQGQQQVADGIHRAPPRGAPVADLMEPLRREIQDQVEAQVRRHVADVENVNGHLRNILLSLANAPPMLS